MLRRSTLLDPPVDGSERRILLLLTAGATQRAVARELNYSVRSIEARLARIRDRLSAPTLYALGASAVRRGLVRPEAMIARARRYRPSDWLPPDPDQLRILRLLADGATDQRVADTLWLTVTTVRRRLRRLAAANGATSRANAGALFEALGWNDASG